MAATNSKKLVSFYNYVDTATHCREQKSTIVALTRTQQYLTKQLSFFCIREKPRSLFKNKYNNQMARSPLCHHHGKIVCLANSVIRMRFMRNEKGCVGAITISQKKKRFDVQFKYKISMQDIYTRFIYKVSRQENQ